MRSKEEGEGRGVERPVRWLPNLRLIGWDPGMPWLPTSAAPSMQSLDVGCISSRLQAFGEGSRFRGTFIPPATAASLQSRDVKFVSYNDPNSIYDVC